MLLLVNHTKPTNTLYWNKYLSTADNYKTASGKLLDNFANRAILIIINCVISKKMARDSKAYVLVICYVVKSICYEYLKIGWGHSLVPSFPSINKKFL